MLKRLMRLLNIISDWTGYVLGVMIFGLMLLILVEVFSRYVLNSPLGIADEIGAYMLVAITFMGLGYTWKEKGHVRVEFLVNALSPKNRKILRTFTLLIATVFSIILAYSAWEFVSYTAMFKVRSGSWLRIPLKWPQMPIIAGAVLLSLQLISELLSTILGVTLDEGSK
jgi:TRAP-type C4-dicarboxylate transport system permease small subunit